jgi:hypothetical protein
MVKVGEALYPGPKSLWVSIVFSITNVHFVVGLVLGQNKANQQRCLFSFDHNSISFHSYETNFILLESTRGHSI